jgi:hypothetical protein
MKLKLTRQYLECIALQYMPQIFEMAKVRQSLYNIDSSDFWNAQIITEVTDDLWTLFDKKYSSFKGSKCTVNLTKAQAYCLYMFMYKFPIDGSQFWHCMMRDKLIHQLNQFITNPDAQIVYDITN